MWVPLYLEKHILPPLWEKMGGRVDSNDQDLPNLIIISLPWYIGVVGPERYMTEFISFKKWIQEFITSGRDENTSNTRVSRSHSCLVEVYEGFSLFKEGGF